MNIPKQYKFIYENSDSATRRRLGWFALLSIISPLINLFSISAIIPILNAMLNGTATTRDILFAFGMAGLMLLSGVFDIVCNVVSNKLTYEGAHNLSCKLYELQMKEDLLSHNKKDGMQALALIRTDTLNCIGIMKNTIIMVVHSAMLVAFFGVFVYYDGLIGVGICILVILEMFVIYRFNAKKMIRYGEKIRELSIRANGQVTTAYGAFKELNVEEEPGLFQKEYEQLSLEVSDVHCELGRKNAVVGVIMRNLIYMIMFLLLALLMVVDLDINAYLPQVIVSVMLAIKVLPMGSSVVNSLNAIKTNNKSFEAVKEALERFGAIKEREAEWAKLREKHISFKEGLKVSGLDFAYPNGKVIFEKAECEIPAGKSVAIIGASGAGKTTFLDIILGLIPAQGGEIRYDDYDIVSHTDENGKCRGNLGRIVSYIPQIVYLNGSTIKRNVAFFVRDDEADEEKVKECLKRAVIWDDVKEMPEGINTLIGPPGISVSGGQRQRIALARALYKDFELLIMDEATAALDMETEAAVIDSIRKVKRDKTLLMVTHHMSLAEECDILYKIENKKLVRVR